MSNAIQLATLLLSSLLLLISFNNCGGTAPEQNLAASQTIACDQVADALRTPNSIADTINLINALPKPTSITCFLKSLKKPLKVMAVNNGFSAQPADGNQSPRIFIVNTKLALSVAPAGAGKFLLELSEPSSATRSIKGELGFPIVQTIDPLLVFSTTADPQSPGNSRCILCHRNEEKIKYGNIGFAFNSEIVRPNELQRVFSLYLRNQAYMCNPATDKYRCDMLNAIFMTGEGQDSDFPF